MKGLQRADNARPKTILKTVAKKSLTKINLDVIIVVMHRHE